MLAHSIKPALRRVRRRVRFDPARASSSSSAASVTTAINSTTESSPSTGSRSAAAPTRYNDALEMLRSAREPVGSNSEARATAQSQADLAAMLESETQHQPEKRRTLLMDRKSDLPDGDLQRLLKPRSRKGNGQGNDIPHLFGPRSSDPIQNRASKDRARKSSHRSPTLEHLTTVLAQHNHLHPPPTTLEEAVSRFDSSLLPQHAGLPRSPASLSSMLHAKLRQHQLDEQAWLAMVQALNARSWPQVRTCMVSIPDQEWPSFVLNHALPLIATPSEASDGLALVVSKVPTAKAWRLREFFHLLAQIILHKLPAINLADRLTDFFFQMEKRHRHKRKLANTIDAACLSFASLLVQHGHEATRRSAERLLAWAKDFDVDLHHSLCIIFLRLKVPLVKAVSDTGFLKPAKRPRSSATFLTTELAETLLVQFTTNKHRLRRGAYRSAILAAGRDRRWDKVESWYDDLVLLGQQWDQAAHLLQNYRGPRPEHDPILSDMRVYMQALSRARSGTLDTWAAFDLLQRSLESDDEGALSWSGVKTWETMLTYVSRDAKVRPEKVLAMLAIRLDGSGGDDTGPVGGAEEVDGMLGDAMKIASQVGRDPASYTVVMHGLLSRNEPRMAVAVWHAMLQRQVTPTRATLTVLLQALFALGEAKTAIAQVRTWCGLGVEMAVEPEPIDEPLSLPRSSLSKQVDVHLDIPSSRTDPEAAGADGAIGSTNTQKYRIEADPVLVSVIFEGLYQINASETTYSIWSAMRETLSVAPDAPILGILLKCACGNGSLSGSSATGFSPYLAASIFRKILLLQHPELAACSIQELLRGKGLAGLGLGLGKGDGWFLRGEFGMRTVERWMSDRVARLIGGDSRKATDPAAAAVIPYTRTPTEVHSATASRSDTDPNPPAPPPPQLDFVVTFTPELFDHYLRLLFYIRLHPPRGFFQLAEAQSEAERAGVEEMLLVLAWMRRLDVTPLRRTVASICLELEELLPPLSSSSSSTVTITSSYPSNDSVEPNGTTTPTDLDPSGTSTVSDSRGTSSQPDRATKRENAWVLAEWLWAWRGERIWPTDREMQVAYLWKMERTRASERGDESYEERRRWFSFRFALDPSGR